MPTRGRHLERLAGDALAPHVGQVGARCERGRLGRDGRVGPGLVAAQGEHGLGQGGHPLHLLPGDEPGVGHRAPWHDHRQRGDGLHGGDHARDRTHRAVEPQLAHRRPALDASGGKLVVGGQQRQRDGQVEAAADLAHVGRREVDGDPFRGPGATGREQGGAHAVARLTAGRVGQPDDGEARQPGRGVHLDRDGLALGPEDRGGTDGGEHDGSPPVGAAAAPTTGGGRRPERNRRAGSHRRRGV